MGSAAGINDLDVRNKLSAKSAICIQTSCVPNGVNKVLFEKDADRPVSPASITKLLTALTAIKVASGRTNPKRVRLTVLPMDIAQGSGQNVGVGDSFTLRHGLANLLLASSNVTANVIARVIGMELLEGKTSPDNDPVARFIVEMNSVAAGLRMDKSCFLNAHGLAQRGQRSTARDLAKLVNACLASPIICEFWGLNRYAFFVGGPHERRLVVESIFKASSRKVIPDFSIPQFIGGKSGSLWPSVFNLAAVSQTNSGGTLISVTLGSESIAERHTDYLSLLRIGDSFDAV